MITFAASSPRLGTPSKSSTVCVGEVTIEILIIWLNIHGVSSWGIVTTIFPPNETAFKSKSFSNLYKGDLQNAFLRWMWPQRWNLEYCIELHCNYNYHKYPSRRPATDDIDERRNFYTWCPKTGWANGNSLYRMTKQSRPTVGIREGV